MLLISGHFLYKRHLGARNLSDWEGVKYLFPSLKCKSIYNIFKMCFSGFFVVILSLTVQINLPLKSDNFFVSGQTYKISRGSNTFPPHCTSLSRFSEKKRWFLWPKMLDFLQSQNRWILEGLIYVLLSCLISFPAIVRWPIVQMARADYPLVGGSSQGTWISFRDLFSHLFLLRMMGMRACLGVWSKSLLSDSLKGNSLSSSRWVIFVLISRSSFRS